MTWCTGHEVDYVLGLARNERLVGRIGQGLAAVEAESPASGRHARLRRRCLAHAGQLEL